MAILPFPLNLPFTFPFSFIISLKLRNERKPHQARIKRYLSVDTLYALIRVFYKGFQFLRFLLAIYVSLCRLCISIVINICMYIKKSLTSHGKIEHKLQAATSDHPQKH